MAIRYKSSINANYGESKDFVFSMVEDFEPLTVSGGASSMFATLFYKSSIGGGTWSTLTPAGSISEIGITGFYVINLSASEMSPSNGENDHMILEIAKGANGGSGAYTEIIINLAPIPADLKEIDGQDTNGNNATLNLKKLSIVNPNGNAVDFQSTGNNGHGFQIIGHGNGSGVRISGNRALECLGNGAEGIFAHSANGIAFTMYSPQSRALNVQSDNGDTAVSINANLGVGLAVSSDGGNAASFISSGGGHGVLCQGHGGGNGFNCTGGATSGHGFNANGNGSGNGINAYAWGTGNAVACLVQAGNGSGLYIRGFGAGNGVNVFGGATGDGVGITGVKGVRIEGLTSFGAEILSGGTHGMYIHSTHVNGYGMFVEGRNGVYFKALNGHGIYSEVASGDGHGLFVKGLGNGNGINSEGNLGIRSIGTVEGILASGATGLKLQGSTNYGLEIQSTANTGMYIKGGGAFGYGAFIEGEVNGLYVVGNAGNGIWSRSMGSNGVGFLSTGEGSGSGIKAEKGGLGTYDIDADELINIKATVDDIETDTQSIETKIDIIDTNVDTVNVTSQDTNTKVTAIQPTVNDTNSKVTTLQNTVNSIEGKIDLIDTNVDAIHVLSTDNKNINLDVQAGVNSLAVDMTDVRPNTEDTNNVVNAMQSIVNDTNSKVTGLDTTVNDTNTKVSSMQPILNTVNANTQDTNSLVNTIDSNVLTVINNMLQLTTQIDGIDLSEIIEFLLAMANGRFKHNVPSQGLTTFYKRDNITPKFVIQATEFERTRV